MPEHLSGTVRFSVESLLYYAPKVTSTGTALADAVNTAQRQLFGLGDFFGHSWPDEPFRNSYPRCQYAMLIIARQIADEIQGIGGGIEQMARTYGITENQNTADVQRIQANQGQTAARISGTGGLPEPPSLAPNPFAKKPTGPTPSAHPFPSPEPNAPPVPRISYSSANVPQEITPSSYYTLPAQALAPRVAPDPQPGVDPTTWQAADTLSLLGPWPSGDADKMDEAARCWTALTGALDTAWTDLQRYTAYIMADAQGPAADAFQEYVDKLTGHGHGLLFRAIDMAQELRNSCSRQAAEIRAIKSEIEQTLIELGATFVIGQVLSLLTFGSAEAATTAIEAGITARLTALAGKVADYAAAFAKTLEASAESVGKIGAAIFVGGAQSALIGEADLAASNVIGLAFGQTPVQGAAALKAIALDGGIGLFFGQGSAGGLLGLSAATASKRLIDLGEALKRSQDTDPRVAPVLIALGRQLKDGSIGVDMANSAASQLIQEHQVTPVTFITGTISNRFTTAISPHTGAHVKP